MEVHYSTMTNETSITSTKDLLGAWLADASDNGIRFSWVGKDYDTGIGLITLSIDDGHIIDFEMYPLSDIPVFKKSYARSSFFIDGTTKEKSLRKLLERSTKLSSEDKDVVQEREMMLNQNCAVLLDTILG